MMKNSQKTGFSLIEILIGSVLLIIVIFGITSLFQSQVGRKKAFEGKRDTEREVFAVVSHLMKLGRLSQTCSIPTASSVECDVNFSGAPGGTLTKVRLRQDGSRILYETFDGTWNSNITYVNMLEFQLCDDTSMSSGACPLDNIKINQVHTASLVAAKPTLPGRFFRFRIRGAQDVDALGMIQIESAFFVRNPTPYDDVAYKWIN